MGKKAVSANHPEQAVHLDKDPATFSGLWNLEPPDLEGLLLGEAFSEERLPEEERFLSSLVPQGYNDQSPGLSLVIDFERPYLAEPGRFEPKTPGLSGAPAPRDRWDCSTEWSSVSSLF